MVCAAELCCLLKYLSKHGDVKDPPQASLNSVFLVSYTYTWGQGLKSFDMSNVAFHSNFLLI